MEGEAIMVKPFRSIDGIRRTGAAPAAAVAVKKPQPAAAPAKPLPYLAPRQANPALVQPQPAAASRPDRKYMLPPAAVAAKPRRRIWSHLQLPVFVLGGMLAGLFMQSVVLGMGIAAMYALVAWFGRVPSRITFVLAFLSLLTVVALLVIRQNVELAGNFATYTFLLLVTGIISLMLESRVSPKLKRGKIRGKI
jgi:hypothetical protein